MSQPDLISWYGSVLATANARADERGFVFLGRVPQDEQIAVAGTDEQGQRLDLALPTDYILNNAANTTVRFHPLAEDFNRGPSPVLEQYVDMALTELNTTFMVTAGWLLHLTASEGLHAGLSPVQHDLLRIAKKASATTTRMLRELTERISIDDREFQPISMFLKRKARIKDRVHSWGVVVTFPLYERLKALEGVSGAKIKSVSISKENLRCLLGIYEYLFPNIETEHAYSFGSNSSVAPKLESVLGAIYGIATELNALVEDLGQHAHDTEQIPLEWSPQIGELEVFVPQLRRIPIQPGNLGQTSRQQQGFTSLDELQRRAGEQQPASAQSTVVPTTPQSAVVSTAGMPAAQTSAGPAQADVDALQRVLNKMHGAPNLNTPAPMQAPIPMYPTTPQPSQPMPVMPGMQPAAIPGMMPAAGHGIPPSIPAPAVQQPQWQWAQTPQGLFVFCNGQYYHPQQFQQMTGIVVMTPQGQPLMPASTGYTGPGSPAGLHNRVHYR